MSGKRRPRRLEDGQRQRVAAPFVACVEVAFEIHLPQVVGKRMLETLPRSRGTAGFNADAAIAAQDAVDRARRKDDAAVAREDVGNFVRPPGWMVVTRGEDTVFLGLKSALGAAFRATGAVVHIVAVEPFVDGFTADAEATGKLADVGLWLAGESNKFCTLFFHSEGSPGHGIFRQLGRVKCYPCFRTPLPMWTAYTLLGGGKGVGGVASIGEDRAQLPAADGALATP